MRIVHEDRGETLASEVEVASTRLAQLRGLRFRRSLPPNHALLFPFEGTRRRDVDTLFVPFAIDVIWAVDDRVERVDRLRPWLGVAIAKADTLIELPAGAARAVSVGDTVRVED